MWRKQISGRMMAAGIVCIIMILLAVFSMDSTGEIQENVPKIEKGEPMQVWIVSDIHLLSPDLTDGGTLFTRTVENGDGKMVGDSAEIMDALVGKALEEKPDALIVAGDLTFNGERESLECLASKLDRIQDAGIPVLVIPGNHDIEYPYAYRYEGEQAVAAERISEADFRDICGKFGYNPAVAKDRGSFSYLYVLADDFCVLFLDANTVKNPGKISDGTLEWMEGQLKWAKERGMEVVSVTHQNILRQNSLMYKGFVLDNYTDVSRLLKEYGVKIHFSGHSHIQHSRTEENLTDIAVGSLTVAPLRYGLIEIDEERRVSYEPASLGILQDEAREFFGLLTMRQVGEELDALSIEMEIKNEMLDFAVAVNREYFAGTLTDEDMETLRRSRAWNFWEENGKAGFWYYYLDSILNR